MITNFVNDAYLERFYPDLESYRAGAQTDFTDQIDLAFEILLNDLRLRGLNPRLLGVPLDLNRDASTTHTQHLVSETISATDNGYAWEWDVGSRFVVNLTTKSTVGDDWSVWLQGSNKTTRPDDNDSTWTNVKELNWAAAVAASEKNGTFTAYYRWYRRRVVLNSGSGSITFVASVHDTIFDNLIAWKAIELIASSWDTNLSTLWQARVEDCKTSYQTAIESIKTSYDEDEDGIPEPPDDSVTSQVRMTR